MFLRRLQNKYDLPNEICKEINKTLIYDSKMAVAGLVKFVESLPPQLRIAVSIHVYRKVFTTHPFFSDMKSKRLLSYLG
jgi:hypothetical protein